MNCLIQILTVKHYRYGYHHKALALSAFTEPFLPFPFILDLINAVLIIESLTNCMDSDKWGNGERYCGFKAGPVKQYWHRFI